MKITKEGVTVVTSANAGKCSYRVEISIPKTVLKDYISINCKNYFKLEFHLKKQYSKEVMIRFTQRFSFINGSEMVDTGKASTLTFENNYYKCSILLRPKFYIPHKIRKRNERIKNHEQKYSSVSSNEKPVPSSSKYTNYSHNNATKPFSGGSVTPK